jgi:hypothetical protein
MVVIVAARVLRMLRLVLIVYALIACDASWMSPSGLNGVWRRSSVASRRKRHVDTDRFSVSCVGESYLTADPDLFCSRVADLLGFNENCKRATAPREAASAPLAGDTALSANSHSIKYSQDIRGVREALSSIRQLGQIRGGSGVSHPHQRQPQTSERSRRNEKDNDEEEGSWEDNEDSSDDEDVQEADADDDIYYETDDEDAATGADGDAAEDTENTDEPEGNASEESFSASSMKPLSADDTGQHDSIESDEDEIENSEADTDSSEQAKSERSEDTDSEALETDDAADLQNNGNDKEDTSNIVKVAGSDENGSSEISFVDPWHDTDADDIELEDEEMLADDDNNDEVGMGDPNASKHYEEADDTSQAELLTNMGDGEMEQFDAADDDARDAHDANEGPKEETDEDDNEDEDEDEDSEDDDIVDERDQSEDEIYPSTSKSLKTVTVLRGKGLQMPAKHVKYSKFTVLRPMKASSKSVFKTILAPAATAIGKLLVRMAQRVVSILKVSTRGSSIAKTVMKYVDKTPPFARFYTLSTLSLSLFSLIFLNNEYPFKYLDLNLYKAIFGFQYWRLFTGFMFFGNVSANFLLTLHFIWEYFSSVEKMYLQSPEEFGMLVGVAASALIALYAVLGLNSAYLGHNLSSVLVYVWSRMYEGK